MARIALMADSRWRDTPGLALVRKELVDLGHDARTISFQISQAVQLFKPDILVLNHLFGRRNQELARYVKRFGGKVVIIPTEGRPDTSQGMKWVAQQAEMQNLYDLYLSWNEQVAQLIPKGVVTGCPRFDVHRPEYQHLIESPDVVRAKYGIADDAKVVGITTSFPSAKFVYTNRQFHKQDWKDLKIADDPFDLANGEYRQAQRFMNWIQYVRHENPDTVFILKSHPMEDRQMWQSFCEENNIIFAPPDYIQNFLQVCDLLISRIGCSTAQDAWLMHKPVIQLDLRPVRDSEFDGAALAAARVGQTVANPIDLDDIIRTPHHWFDDKYWQIANRYLDDYGYFTDRPSSEMVVEEIDKLTHDVSTNGALTFDDEIMLNKLQMELAKNTAYPSPMELHTHKHISENVVWSKELEI